MVLSVTLLGIQHQELDLGGLNHASTPEKKKRHPKICWNFCEKNVGGKKKIKNILIPIKFRVDTFAIDALKTCELKD